LYVQIDMENMTTKKHYSFECGRWLARNEDDGEVIRELPAEGEDIKHPEPRKYLVYIYQESLIFIR